jgi:hypothetical protein
MLSPNLQRKRDKIARTNGWIRLPRRVSSHLTSRVFGWRARHKIIVPACAYLAACVLENMQSCAAYLAMAQVAQGTRSWAKQHTYRSTSIIWSWPETDLPLHDQRRQSANLSVHAARASCCVLEMRDHWKLANMTPS